MFGESGFFDLAALCALVRIASPGLIFEFGTFTGNSGLNMLLNARPDARLITLDLAPQERTKIDGLDWEQGIDDTIIARRLRRPEIASRVVQLFADSRQFDPTPYAAQVDFIWVDACHEYEFMRNDTEKAFQMLRPGGTIAWHDLSIRCPGVARHLREVATRHEVRRVIGTNVAFCRP